MIFTSLSFGDKYKGTKLNIYTNNKSPIAIRCTRFNMALNKTGNRFTSQKKIGVSDL
jgi:hypothetical protein